LTHNDRNVSNSTTTIQLTGRGVQPGISVTPNPFAFGNVPINVSSGGSIWITNTGTADLVITQIIVNGDGFTFDDGVTIPMTVPAGEQRNLDSFTFFPTLARSYTGNITLTHNAPGSPTTINLTGTGIGPAITINPNPLAFGDVTINTYSNQNIRITNNGNAPLNITEILIYGYVDSYSLPNGETLRTIDAGSYYDLAIRFLPTATTTYYDYILLRNNDFADHWQTAILLSGRGVEQSK